MARERTRTTAVSAKAKTPAVNALTAREKNTAKRRFIELTYRLIEYKIMYYYPDIIQQGYHDHFVISDDDYDNLEREYLRLCITLGYVNSIVHKTYPDIGAVKGEGMMEVDFSKPTVHLVLRKWGVKDWQDKVGISSPAMREYIRKETDLALSAMERNTGLVIENNAT